MTRHEDTITTSNVPATNSSANNDSEDFRLQQTVSTTLTVSVSSYRVENKVKVTIFHWSSVVRSFRPPY